MSTLVWARIFVLKNSVFAQHKYAAISNYGDIFVLDKVYGKKHFVHVSLMLVVINRPMWEWSCRFVMAWLLPSIVSNHTRHLLSNFMFNRLLLLFERYRVHTIVQVQATWSAAKPHNMTLNHCGLQTNLI